MNNNYPRSTSALFGFSNRSTPSASSSNVDSMSPRDRAPHASPAPGPNSHFGLVPEPAHPLPPTYLPAYYTDRRTPDLPPSYFAPTGSDNGDLNAALTANTYITSPGIVGLYPRPPQASSSRHLLDDISLPSPLRPHLPLHHSPNPSLGIPLPGNRQWPQARGQWHDPSVLDWAGSSGEGGSHPGQSESLAVDLSDDGRPYARQAARQSSESSSQPSNNGMQRTYSGPPPHASPMTEYDYPKSAAYPGNLYSDLAGGLGNWGPRQEVTGQDCGQALSIYEHLFASLPHFRPIPTGHQSNIDNSQTQSLQPLLDLSAEGMAIFSQHQAPAPPVPAESRPHTNNQTPSPSGVPPTRRGKEKPNTKCMGCGATETPEWRRGPLGPRTLCNACGLVHMKLQRKRKKQDEKLAAAKADAEGGGSSGEKPPVAKVKKVKREKEPKEEQEE